jgi:hypothetical protein
MFDDYLEATTSLTQGGMSGSAMWVEFPSGAKLHIAAEVSPSLLSPLIDALRG